MTLPLGTAGGSARGARSVGLIGVIMGVSPLPLLLQVAFVMLFAVAHQLLRAATAEARRSERNARVPTGSWTTSLVGVSDSPPSAVKS